MAEMIENARTSSDTLEVDEAHKIMKDAGAFFIDVRSKERFERRHVKGAVNIPLGEIGHNRSSLPGDKDAPVIAVCDVGKISLIGMLYLKSLGHRNVKSMNGGTTAWAERGLPIE